MRAGKHKDVFVAQFSDQNSLIFGTSEVVFFSFHFFKIAVKGKLLRSCSIDKSRTRGLKGWFDAMSLGP